MLSLQNMIGVLFHTYRAFQSGLAIFQAFSCHMWPVATILDSSALDTTFKLLKSF